MTEQPLAGDRPTAAEQELYLAALTAGGRLRVTDVPAARAGALAGLLELGLLVPEGTGVSYRAANPRAVAARVGAELRSEATRLLVHAEGLPGSFADLAQAYEAMPRSPGQPGGATHIEGTVHIRQRISELLSECTREMLAAQPGPRPASGLRMVAPQDVALLRRGARMRTLYQPVPVGGRAAAEYAAMISGHGAEVRVLDEPYQRMLVFDRAVAVVPASDDHNRAAFITEPAAVGFLVSLFERDWARAESVDWAAVRGRDAHRAPLPDRVARLLAMGLTQRAVAGRLGLSERTVAGHISRLRTEHGARTLFQLGWQLRGRGRDG